MKPTRLMIGLKACGESDGFVGVHPEHKIQILQDTKGLDRGARLRGSTGSSTRELDREELVPAVARALLEGAKIWPYPLATRRVAVLLFFNAIAKSTTMVELYGSFNFNTVVWTDGLVAIPVREAVIFTSDYERGIDGPVDTV